MSRNPMLLLKQHVRELNIARSARSKASDFGFRATESFGDRVFGASDFSRSAFGSARTKLRKAFYGESSAETMSASFRLTTEGLLNVSEPYAAVGAACPEIEYYAERTP